MAEVAAPASSLRREMRVIALIALAHGLSHVYMLALPPLFPVVRDELGFDFLELGLAVTVYALATGVVQTPMGFVCEKLGARPVLFAGLLVNAAAILGIAFIDAYWQLLLLMALGGIGSSVFHPADYQILAGTVDDDRVGRAFAVHSFGGQAGFSVAPIVIIGLATLADWRFALFAIGAAGIALSFIILAASGTFQDAGRPMKRTEERLSLRDLLTSPVTLAFFAFYAALASANLGITHFGVAALTQSYGLDLASANLVVAVYMTAAVITVLPGGWLADRTRDASVVLILGFAGSGVLVALVAIGSWPLWALTGLLVAVGALRGLVIAPRDALVRHSVPAASVGTTFAFVTTGVLVGHVFSPLVYGLLLDLGFGSSVFLVSAVFSLACVATVLRPGGRDSRRSSQQLRRRRV